MFSYQETDVEVILTLDKDCVTLSHQQFKQLYPEFVGSNYHRYWSKNPDNVIYHAMFKDGQYYMLDPDYPPAIWALDNFKSIHTKEIQKLKERESLILNQIKQNIDFNKSHSPTAIFTILQERGLLTKILNSKDVNSLISFLFYASILPNQKLAVEALVSIIVNNQFSQEEINSIQDICKSFLS